MKWLHVHKAKGLITLLVLMLIASCWGMWVTFRPVRVRTRTEAEGIFQLGFYDFLSQRQEIYDSSINHVKAKKASRRAREKGRLTGLMRIRCLQHIAHPTHRLDQLQFIIAIDFCA